MKVKRATIENFSQKVKSKKNIICFGAGIALRRFLDYQEYSIDNEIKFIVDNSKEIQGTVMHYGNKDFSIKSPNEMLDEIIPEDIILITTAEFQAVLRQLESYNQLENTECFFYHFLRWDQDDYERQQSLMPSCLTAKEHINIPKIIHYCWFGRNAIPKQNRIWMESWKKYCPDYQIIEWNENNYDVSKNLYMKQAYEKEKWAFVSDYARLDIVEQYGGVYLDTDVELIKNLDVLLQNEAFCGFESKRYVSFGVGFGAEKNHKLIAELKDEYEKRSFVLKNGKLNETVCPVYQTKLLERYGLKRNGQIQLLENITVYPVQVLCAMSPYSFEMMENLDNSYGIHHFAGSWLDKKPNFNNL